MEISVIICTRNRADNLARTLESFKDVAIPSGIRAEIVVVDNASIDDTPAVARATKLKNAEVRYLYERRAGKSIALNTAMSQTRGPIMLFTDDNIRFPRDWLNGMCDPIIQGKGDVVAGQVTLAPHLNKEWMAWAHRTYCASSEGLSQENLDQIKGANWAFSRSVLDVVPSFDPELGPGALGFCEETLFIAQLKQTGKRFCVSTGQPLIHHFDEARLLRRNWLITIKRMGRSFAYVHHHWRHETTKRPYALFFDTFARYYYRRMFRRHECSAEEGVPIWELVLLERLHRLRHYIAMRNCPRNYEKRGLIKLRTS